MKRLTIVIFIITALLIAIGCQTPEESSSSSTISGANGESSSSPVAGITLNSKISGSVTSSVVSSSASISGNISPSASIGKQYATSSTSCDYSDFEAHMIGGAGVAISKGRVTGGSFQASVDSDHEVVLKFVDCGIRCFGKAGSTDLVCDAIADAVVGALEGELNESIETSSLFKGLSIAKIAEGIVETLKLMSALDPTNNIIGSLTDAAAVGGETGKTQMKEIIMQSTVGTLFTSLATLAVEKKTENQALAEGLTLAEAKKRAAAAAWSIEKVVKMLVGIGMEVVVDLDGEMTMYSDLMTQIDDMADTNFMAQLKAYLLVLYDKLYGANPETSDVTLVCVARKDSNSGPQQKITYPPYKVGDQLTCMHASASSDTDEMGITTSNGTQLATDFRVEAKIKLSTDEANRNDPTGTREDNYGGINEIQVHFVDIFSEFDDAVETGGVCADHITVGANGPTDIGDGFIACAKANGLDKYFSGLIGIYKFMRDVDLRESKFSLNDIYQAMVGVDYTGLRMQANFWQIGASDYWLEVDTGGDWNLWMSAYQLSDTGTTDSNGRAVFNAECARNISGAIDLCDGSGPLTGPLTANESQLEALFNNYTPTYASVLQTFENIPSMTEIKASIFKDAHHEPYNVAGPKTFHVQGANTGISSDNWQSDTPIMCKINNPNRAGEFAVGTSSITCELASSTTWDSDGKPASTSTYQSYYALQGRGGGGSDSGDNDRYYGLVNINNGTEYRVNGRELRIRGIQSGFTPADNPTLDGKTLTPVSKEFCDTWTDDSDGATQTHCWHERFTYVALSFPSTWFQAAYYFPYTWEIPITSVWWDSAAGDFVEEEWNMWIAITKNGTPNDYSDDQAVCLDSAGVTVDVTNDEYKIITPFPEVSVPGNLVDCFTATGTYYYLTPEWSGASSTRANQKYRLIRNDGAWMWSVSGTDELVSLTAIETETKATIDPQATIGPPGNISWMLGFDIANLGYDAKFDPFCDDQDADGECDCSDDDGDGECTLVDTPTEPTISEPAGWPGSGSANDIKTIIAVCGGKSGEALAVCFQWLLPNKSINIGTFNANWKVMLECQDSSKALQWADRGAMMTHTAGTDVPNYGNGCGAGSGQDNLGPVRLKNMRKRRNAYNVERPNKMLKLISSATATIGTGVTIGKTDEVFVFQEALAMALLRVTFPMHAKVKYNGEVLEGLRVYMEKSDIPGKPRGLSNGLLRAFLEGAGEISPAANISN
jgi:hypothetical protein